MNSNQNSNWKSSWFYLFFPCFLTRSFGLVQKKYNFRQKNKQSMKEKTRWFSFPKKMKTKKNRICVFRSYYSKKNKCINKYREDFFSLICQNCDSNNIESYYIPTSVPLAVELGWADSAGWRFVTKSIDLTNFYQIYHFLLCAYKI